MSEFALIIEDNEDYSEIFSQALHAAGFETEAIRDGLIAQQRIVSVFIPQVVVLDMHLPNVSGETLIKQMRGDARFQKTYIIVATADALMGEDMRNVADFVLLKPTSFTQLRDLALYLHRKQA